MKSPQSDTQMQNPPSDETKMTSKVASSKMVKIQAVESIMVGKQMVAPGAVVMATEEEAAEYCDRRFEGPYSHTGETTDPTPRRSVTVRAKRV